MRDAIPQILNCGAASIASAMEENPPSKTFHHAIDVYLKDSNAFMNTYFARYFEWQGICRERWFQECVHGNLLEAGGVLITKRANNEYVNETFPFQRVDCHVNTFRVRQCSAYMLFRFYVENNLVSLGYQQLVFADRNRQISRFPQIILDKAKEYEWTI